ncbi:hypothetical protein N7462_003123 [Penicillium macrosclerotiorum]|uniref:uncharacterized protein n=1 Tax=Penicillium macrosclerotiorum TaxID=303699 RepID=UPI0025496760|nr:uncharacterized protein N7462_003123 [Penicillium macrosclerotiorum]KAJ5688731.1 hypothetical protein N7462_003123 [Penicillium macrosclerotiorum]
MKLSTFISLTASTLSLLPWTSAWEITWNDSNNKEHTRSGHGPSDCIAIHNPAGHVFKIDSQGENGINMLLFTNSKCSGDPAGMATEVFSKEASRDLLGFKVVSLSSSTASTDSTTKTSGSHTESTSPTTSSSETASANSSQSNGESMATKTTTHTTSTASSAMTTSATPSGTSSTTSSASSVSTSNAAVQLAGSGESAAKGLMGGMFGWALLQLII